ncbi:MAG TPA: TolC family protein [Bryobacteraceae bacterium]|nr:TolC family protein [Bryobacteraceae bacterium]
MRTVLAPLLFAAACLAQGPLPPLPPQNAAPAGAPRIDTPLSFTNSARVHELIRAGNMYLSLSDALALAIENNLDIELERWGLPSADSDLLRAKGGGVVRGLDFILAETPVGVGGPLAPVVTNPATTQGTSGTSVATNALELGVLSEPQDNYSMQGTISQSNGSNIPIFDPALVGQLNWTHTSAPQSSFATYQTNALVSNITNANFGVQQGFASGAQVGLNFNNSHDAYNAINTSYSPFSAASLGLTVTQPLLRGFGPSLNRRYIRIAANERRISSLLFRQQVILTVYGIVRLYTDFVALSEDVKVKQEAATLAARLFDDVKAQVEEGTLAQVEMTRANAQVYSTRQDLINSRGLLEEQEAILKNQLTRTGNADPEVASAHIIPTDILTIPAQDEIRPMQDLINEALANRPDLGQARLQIDNSRIGLAGSRNATLPEVDLVGVAQNSGLGGLATPLLPAGDTALVGGYGSALDQVLARNYPTYGIGVQVTLPIHNRIAEADLARDEIQVKQSEIRLRQLQNQARLEVEDALIAMRRSRASYEAAVEARRLQQESLDAEQAKFEVGASTSFFVIQYESLLEQAKSTEVAAKSSWVKARAALQRAMGTILDENHISFDNALKGKM